MPIGALPLAHTLMGETLQNSLLHVLEAPSPAVEASEEQEGPLTMCDSTFRTALRAHPYGDEFGGLSAPMFKFNAGEYDAGINGHATYHHQSW